MNEPEAKNMETVEQIRHREKYKAVIEFSKVILSLATAVLTAFVALLFVSGAHVDSGRLGWTSIGLVIGSVCTALYGLGWSIDAIGSGSKSSFAILAANCSPLLLIAAILVGLFAVVDGTSPLSVDATLNTIATSTRSLSTRLDPQQVRSIRAEGDDYIVEYESGGARVRVVVARKSGEVRSIE